MNFVHVQQRTTGEGMWDLCPSFVLSFHPVESVLAYSVGQRQGTRLLSSVCEHETGIEKKVPHNSVDSILENLQEDYSSFDIQQKFNRYCSLSGREHSNSEGLTCSIPIQVSNTKVLVDYLSLSKKKNSAYSLHWTEIYCPTQAKQVIGNPSSCSALLSWLQCWERKCYSKNSASDKRKLQKGQKGKAFDCSDPDFFPGKDASVTSQAHDIREEDLLPAALLHGPHGSGKTAAVYACAAEAGLKVFEINSGVLRNKSQLLLKLKEVTLSRQVRPFAWAGAVPQKSRILSTVILFDEVDIVFCEDHGFLQAVQEIISSTRYPVILTCSDPVNLDIDMEEVLVLPFHLPSQLELAINISLMSMANGWPLSLQQSQQLCQYFQRDIRKAILHLQLMLSWQGSDPTAPLGYEVRDSVTTPLALCMGNLHSPWRTCDQPCYENSTLNGISSLSDWRSELDCVPLHQHMIQPWTVKLEASLVDELPENSCSSPLGEELIDFLSQPLHAGCTQSTGGENETTKWEANRNIVEQLFSKSCQMSRCALATDCIPFLAVMCEHEQAQRSVGSRIRQSRHYFYPHHLELSKWLENRRHLCS